MIAYLPDWGRACHLDSRLEIAGMTKFASSWVLQAGALPVGSQGKRKKVLKIGPEVRSAEIVEAWGGVFQRDARQ